MRWSDRRNDGQVTDAMIWLVVFVAVCGIIGILAEAVDAGSAKPVGARADGPREAD